MATAPALAETAAAVLTAIAIDDAVPRREARSARRSPYKTNGRHRTGHLVFVLRFVDEAQELRSSITSA
jgi:hypothetical protein